MIFFFEFFFFLIFVKTNARRTTAFQRTVTVVLSSQPPVVETRASAGIHRVPSKSSYELYSYCEMYVDRIPVPRGGISPVPLLNRGASSIFGGPLSSLARPRIKTILDDFFFFAHFNLFMAPELRA